MRITGLSLFGTYDTARTIAAIISLLGWLTVALGAVTAVAGLGGGPLGGLALTYGVAIAIGGILQVAAGQLLKAAVDSADYLRQALLLQVGIAEGTAEIDLKRSSMAPVGGGAHAVPGASPDAGPATQG